MSGRMVRARINGYDYEIPDIWIAGWIEGRRREGRDVTAHDAIAWWHYQAELGWEAAQ